MPKHTPYGPCCLQTCLWSAKEDIVPALPPDSIAEMDQNWMRLQELAKSHGLEIDDKFRATWYLAIMEASDYMPPDTVDALLLCGLWGEVAP